jgi:aminoglycoside phosphotransferase (APT) family kinase protein
MGGQPQGLDLDALARWLPSHVQGAAEGRRLWARRLAGGLSNLTYELGDGDSTWVLRRPPLGHVLPTAHDMVREYRVQRALAGTGVPVPVPLALCEDAGVVGAPFYVMDRVAGVVLRTDADTAELTPDEGRRCCDALVRTLVAIHAVDHEAVGLGGFGHPDGYLARQVRRWGQQWERSATRDLPAVGELRRRLEAAVPVSGPPTIVHGDYRLDNLMLAPDDPGRVLAVLDWEMATLGDPLADLGLLLVYWSEPGAPGRAIRQPGGAGFMTRAQVADAYARASGRGLDALDFYVMLGGYKLAIVMEGIHARFKAGQTVGNGFAHIGEDVPAVVEAALDVGRRSNLPGLR